jgi:hypothetical protein
LIEFIRQTSIEINTAIIALVAAVFASSITICVVLLGNKHNQKMQEKELKHQAKESNLDCKMELRKAIYLEDAEQLTVASQHLVTLNHTNFSIENPANKINPFLVVANKALLVANDGSFEKINKLLSELMKTFLLLVKEAKPSQEILIERNIQQANYDYYHAERSRILASMTQFNDAARVDSQVWNALNRNLELASEKAEEASLKRS